MCLVLYHYRDYLFSGVFLLHSRDTYTTIHIYMQKHGQHNNDEHTSLEKYTSHTLFEMVAKGCKRVMCER